MTVRIIDGIKIGKEIREEFAVKPSEVVEYEERLSKAIFFYNRAEGYRRKGESKSAREITLHLLPK